MAIPDYDPSRDEPPATKEPTGWRNASDSVNRWLLLAALLLILVIAVGAGYTIHEEHSTERMASANSELGRELTEAQSQLATLESRLNSMTASVATMVPTPSDESWNAKPQPRSKPVRPRVRRVRRQKQAQWMAKFQEQLLKQQQRIAAAEQSITQTQADLANNAASTQSGLSNLGGAIARNHAQLVALERLGQRDYYEFSLSKSKQFAHEGPIGISLRHTNTKHQSYNVVLLVDDSELTRKNVNLYEPVVLETDESPQPLNLVVNRIGKNYVHGYVSAPKGYGERASANNPPLDAVPVSQVQSTPQVTLNR